MVVGPYREHITDNITVRWFDDTTDPDSLVWHRDMDDRLVRVVKGTGWKFQFDNELPQDFDIGSIIYIEKYRYHRIIKGNGCLVIEIVEGTSDV